MSGGRFIALEGGEAAGKSTQAARLAARLDAVQTREPGGTALGGQVRSIFLNPDTGPIAAKAEVLLMAADRAQHIDAVVAPALAAGRHVVSDRSLHSSVAYQGYGRGIDPDEIRRLSAWASEGVVPDLVLLLDLPVDAARRRVAGVAPDRLESESLAFHERVRNGFLALADADPARWAVIDADRDPDSIAAVVWSTVVDRLPDLS